MAERSLAQSLTGSVQPWSARLKGIRSVITHLHRARLGRKEDRSCWASRSPSVERPRRAMPETGDYHRQEQVAIHQEVSFINSRFPVNMRLSPFPIPRCTSRKNLIGDQR